MLTLFWVEDVTQTVAQNIKRQNRQKNRRGGKGDHMRIAAHGAVAVLHQCAPAGAPSAVGIVNADADETQRRLRQDGRGNAERQRDDDRSDDIRQDVAQDDSSARSAERLGALDEEKLLGLQHLAAGDARETYPRNQT